MTNKMKNPIKVLALSGLILAVLAIGTAICQRWAPETGQLRLAELDQASSAPAGG